MKNNVAPKLFISYSHSDEWYKEELVKFLIPFREENILDWWDASQLVPGERYDEEILNRIGQSDIFLFLISPDSISSNYIKRIELECAYELYAKQKIIIVPVIIRPCAWRSLKINKFHVIPKGGTAITEYKNKDLAFLDVAENIKKLAEIFKRDKKYLSDNGLKNKAGSKDPERDKPKTSYQKKVEPKPYLNKIRAETYIEKVKSLTINNNKKNKNNDD